MQILLDTHTLIWFVERDKSLSVYAKSTIESSGSTVYVSIVSLWEIAIKSSKGKLNLRSSLEKIIDDLPSYGFSILLLHPEDTLRIRDLPYHHPDPFDRALIAQAQCNDLVLVSCDSIMKQYSIPVLW